MSAKLPHEVLAPVTSVEELNIERLRERERYFHTLLDNTLDIISMLDADRVREFVTPAVTRVLGYTVAEWLAMDPLAMVHPEDRAQLAKTIDDLFASRDAGCECRLMHKDGTYRWMELQGRDLRQDGRASGVLGVYRDITERKLAEEALEEQRRVLEYAQAVAKVGSWVRDYRDPERLVWSAETYRIFGIDPREEMSQTRFLKTVHPDDLALVADPPQSDTGIFSAEHRIVHADGTILWVHELARFELDPLTGKRVRLVGTVQDITERKRNEEQVRQSQKMEAIGRLAGGVAHDFNNLLALIMAQCEWIQRKLGDEHPLQAELEEIAGASARGAALTRQLLAFSRRQRNTSRVLRLDAIVAQTERLLRRLLGEHIAIEVELAAGSDAVFVDRGNLEQVLLNLAVNARDAMPNGGTLRISTRSIELTAPRVLPTGELAPGRYAVLSVSDEGSGIDARARTHLFEPFFTTKPLGEGTGLGLATVFGIVQEANGGIVVESEPGKGTTFEVLLPRVAELSASETEPQTSHALPRGHETILLVEDDGPLRGTIQRTLSSLGYQVLTAADGIEAMAICANGQTRIDLLLTDLVMPGRDGRATAEILTRARPTLRTVYMSGYAEPELLQPSETDATSPPGALATPTLLAKPFTAQDLAGAVRKSLDV